ncbi:hypothetical protein E8E12_005481 [Didymella heteroderae]|uniref:Uncharacterized protein n=1 Tax=Didymella heteroderae TaxID=1769908 RepID=A0A9P4WNG6_9PLEO|nr:hypothetical protein E8E12_005481 [Didymella heteroderae]
MPTFTAPKVTSACVPEEQFPHGIELDKHDDQNEAHSPDSPALRGSNATQDVDPTRLELDAIIASLKMIVESSGGFLSISSFQRGGSPSL